MEYEKALEMFRAGIEATECEVKKDLYQTAISALEKQIPKKPKETETAFNAHWFHDCPSCGKTQEDDEGEWFWSSFCPFCGQRLDWGDKR